MFNVIDQEDLLVGYYTMIFLTVANSYISPFLPDPLEMRETSVDTPTSPAGSVLGVLVSHVVIRREKGQRPQLHIWVTFLFDRVPYFQTIQIPG